MILRGKKKGEKKGEEKKGSKLQSGTVKIICR